MAVKLWTVHFMRICVANLLLFISLYVLFPVLSVEMADRLGVPAAQTGVIFLFFTLGMFLIGPFHAYLVDAYKRKYVCMFAAALMVVATIGYAFVTNLTELILLGTVQGLAFGIGQQPASHWPSTSPTPHCAVRETSVSPGWHVWE